MQGELDFGVKVKCDYLGWEVPMLSKLLPWLLVRKNELPDMVVVVPTSQSGRRLREALARTGGVFAPKVVTPGAFSKRADLGRQVAELAAWVEVLRETSLDEYRGLFPKDPLDGASEGFGWALSMARQLTDLKWTVEESGLNLREAGWKSMEVERWGDLVRLEQRVTQLLKKWGVPKEVKGVNLGVNVKHVVLAGVSELSPAMKSDLVGMLGRGIEVTCLVHAPEFLKTRFDEWGCPTAKGWCEEEIPMVDWEDKLRVSENPELAAKHVVRRIGEAKLMPSEVGLGLCDRELGMSLQRSFAEAGWELYDPEGKPVHSSSVVLFLKSLMEWLKPWRPIKAYRGLLNLPESEAFLPEGVSRLALIRELDAYVEKRLPESASSAVARMSEGTLKDALQYFLDETNRLEEGSSVRGLRGWVARILSRCEQEAAKVMVDPLVDVFDMLELVESRGKRMATKQVIDYILEMLKGVRIYGDLAGTVLNMEGWLELMYDPAPNVFLVGLHEGSVPESMGENSFLPESFKELLGIPGAQARYARDSYLMHALWASRERVETVVCKNNDAGEPKSISRLLLRSSGEDLAKRVKFLFGEAQDKAANPGAWRRDWTLKLLHKDNPYRVERNENVRPLSPSALRDYLKCPFRFYLKRILKMERYEAGKMELNAMDFGNVVHEVVERFGRNEEIRDSLNAQEISAYFDAELDRVLEARYGNEPRLAVRIQAESARERLRALARKQAEHRADGWRIEHVEYFIGQRKGEEEGIQWKVAGHPISMILDRVDRHEVTGQIRILDYKTSAKGKSPFNAHLTKWKEEERRPQLGGLLELKATARSKPADFRWKDLQLPLYAWFAMEHFGVSEIPEVGYINMPKAVTETAFSIWEDFDDVLLSSAKEWAEGAVRGIEESRFSEPAELPQDELKWDEFHLLAMDGMREAFGLKAD